MTEKGEIDGKQVGSKEREGTLTGKERRRKGREIAHKMIKKGKERMMVNR